MNDLTPQEREAMERAFKAEVEIAFQRGSSGGPERVFEAGFRASIARAQTAETQVRELSSKASRLAHERNQVRRALGGLLAFVDGERLVIQARDIGSWMDAVAVARAALSTGEK